MRSLRLPSSPNLALAVGALGSGAAVEAWLPVVGREGLYEVSDHGRVRSVHNREIVRSDGMIQRRPGRLLRPAPVQTGHLMVNLGVGHPSQRVHTLVLEAFVGLRPDGFQACHNDGNPANNHVSNLRWDTRAENTRDMVRHGTHPQASKTTCIRGHLLAEPNLMPSVAKKGHRGCLACNKAAGTVRHARKRYGWELDRQAEADKHYAQITGQPYKNGQD